MEDDNERVIYKVIGCNNGYITIRETKISKRVVTYLFDGENFTKVEKEE